MISRKKIRVVESKGQERVENTRGLREFWEFRKMSLLKVMIEEI